MNIDAVKADHLTKHKSSPIGTTFKHDVHKPVTDSDAGPHSFYLKRPIQGPSELPSPQAGKQHDRTSRNNPTPHLRPHRGRHTKAPSTRTSQENNKTTVPSSSSTSSAPETLKSNSNSLTSSDLGPNTPITTFSSSGAASHMQNASNVVPSYDVGITVPMDASMHIPIQQHLSCIGAWQCGVSPKASLQSRGSRSSAQMNEARYPLCYSDCLTADESKQGRLL